MTNSLVENLDGVAFIDRDYVPIREAKIPLLDWGFLRSDANQDTISVWKGLFFRLEDHLDRFEKNIAKLRMECPYDRAQIRSIMVECVKRSKATNAYVQIIMTRGTPPIGIRDPRECQNQFYAFCVPYIWIATEAQREYGLKLVVSSIQRIPVSSVDPTLKHYHWLDFQMGLFEAYERGGDTVVLTDEAGLVTEGPGFNIFIVKDGNIGTPRHGVLNGMTRQTVSELCAEIGVSCFSKDIPVEHLINADEVFLSSTAGGIIPVTTVNGHVVGNGKPGPTYEQLKVLYWEKRESGWHGTPVFV